MFGKNIDEYGSLLGKLNKKTAQAVEKILSQHKKSDRRMQRTIGDFQVEQSALQRQLARTNGLVLSQTAQSSRMGNLIISLLSGIFSQMKNLQVPRVKECRAGALYYPVPSAKSLKPSPKPVEPKREDKKKPETLAPPSIHGGPLLPSGEIVSSLENQDPYHRRKKDLFAYSKNLPKARGFDGEKMSALDKYEQLVAQTVDNVPYSFAETAQRSDQLMGSNLGMGVQDAVGFAVKMMDVGTISNVSADNATQRFVNYKAFWNMSVGEIEDYADRLVYTATMSEVSLDKLMTFIEGAGEQTKTLGVSEKVMAGIGAGLMHIGISAEESTEMYNNMLASINKGDIDPKVLALMGYEDAGSLRNDMFERPRQTFKKIIQDADKLSDQQKGSIYNALFGSENQDSIGLLMDRNNAYKVWHRMEYSDVDREHKGFIGKMREQQVIDNPALRQIIHRNRAERVSIYSGEANWMGMSGIYDFYYNMVKGYLNSIDADPQAFLGPASRAAPFINLSKYLSKLFFGEGNGLSSNLGVFGKGKFGSFARIGIPAMLSLGTYAFQDNLFRGAAIAESEQLTGIHEEQKKYVLELYEQKGRLKDEIEKIDIWMKENPQPQQVWVDDIFHSKALTMYQYEDGSIRDTDWHYKKLQEKAALQEKLQKTEDDLARAMQTVEEQSVSTQQSLEAMSFTLEKTSSQAAVISDNFNSLYYIIDKFNGINIQDRVVNPRQGEPPESGKSSLKEKDQNFTKHASGGIITSPHLGLVGEAGPEAIIPLKDTANSLQLWRRTGELLGVGGAVVVNATFAPVIHAPSGSAQEIQSALIGPQQDFLANIENFFRERDRLSYV